VSSVEIWYVHNLPESENVKRELAKVEQTAHAAVKRNYPDCNVESISAKEVGLESLETWYEGTQAPILVTETFSFETRGGYTTSGNKWEAYSTSVPAEWLRDKYNEFGRDLFSANIRDYLGSLRSDRNINNNIKETAKTKPEMFWVFNNGITALVNGFAATSEDESGLLEISGIAIVNGAQTTGALGSVPEADLARAFVPARFVKCDDPQTVQQIIRYNNSQNKIEAADFRSKDLVQTRLRREFTKIPNVEYAGGRRGGAEDSIKRPKNVLQSYTAGQALAAFHGEPAIAYNQKSKIWQSDAIYSRFFHERTGAQHLLFAYSLLKAVESEKVRLKSLDETDRTKQQSEQWETLRKRGATFLLTSAVAASMETILGRSIADHFSLRFSSKKNLGACLGAWEPIVAIGLSFAQSLSEALSRSNLYNKELVRKHLRDYAMHIQALSKVNSDAFERFAVKVKGD
ncbi:MAG: AIPR family protein, partial [Acidobacteriota bacterium]